MESSLRLKTNLKLKDRPCGCCDEPLALGQDAAVCTSCETVVHAACWDQRQGCSNDSCANAPLPQLEDVPAPRTLGAMRAGAPAAAAMPSGLRECVHCLAHTPAGDPVCVLCNQLGTPDGLYHGPRVRAPGAVASMVYGLIGILFCGVIFGIVAIVKSRNAKEIMREHPRYSGEGFATAGFWLGVVDLVFWALFLLAKLGS